MTKAKKSLEICDICNYVSHKVFLWIILLLKLRKKISRLRSILDISRCICFIWSGPSISFRPYLVYKEHKIVAEIVGSPGRFLRLDKTVPPQPAKIPRVTTLSIRTSSAPCERRASPCIRRVSAWQKRNPSCTLVWILTSSMEKYNTGPARRVVPYYTFPCCCLACLSFNVNPEKGVCLKSLHLIFSLLTTQQSNDDEKQDNVFPCPSRRDKTDQRQNENTLLLRRH